MLTLVDCIRCKCLIFNQGEPENCHDNRGKAYRIIFGYYFSFTAIAQEDEHITIDGVFRGYFCSNKPSYSPGSGFYDHRLLDPIGCIPPVEAVINHYRKLPERAGQQHDLNQTASIKPGSVHYSSCILCGGFCSYVHTRRTVRIPS